MSIIPLDLQRRCERRWAARFARKAQKATVGLNKGAAVPRRVDEKPTLASQGIDKNLSAVSAGPNALPRLSERRWCGLVYGLSRSGRSAPAHG
jgi:hypothetical protein